jgi:hypothetical protein
MELTYRIDGKQGQPESGVIHNTIHGLPAQDASSAGQTAHSKEEMPSRRVNKKRTERDASGIPLRNRPAWFSRRAELQHIRIL